jgi:hypothetical protein
MNMSAQRISQRRFGRPSDSRRQRLHWQSGYTDMTQGCPMRADQDTNLPVASTQRAAHPNDRPEIVEVEQTDPDTSLFGHYVLLRDVDSRCWAWRSG